MRRNAIVNVKALMYFEMLLAKFDFSQRGHDRNEKIDGSGRMLVTTSQRQRR